MMANPQIFYGAGARNRTGTESPPVDFESTASTNFTTPAWDRLYRENAHDCQSIYATRLSERRRWPDVAPPLPG